MVSWNWRRKSTVKAPPVPEILRAGDTRQDEFQRTEEEKLIPRLQSVLLLNAIRQPYEVIAGYTVPETQHDHELLVKVQAVGLNPIDWKAP